MIGRAAFDGWDFERGATVQTSVEVCPGQRPRRLRLLKSRSQLRHGSAEKRELLRVPYPNNSGALTTAGGLVFTGFTDGSLMAYDDTSMEELWKINVGTGFQAPPMTFEVNGKQYVAILSGLSAISKGRHAFTPELREMRNQTMLFVFGL
jgi:alcohol dehydrogenase (cytochrome c)